MFLLATLSGVREAVGWKKAGGERKGVAGSLQDLYKADGGRQGLWAGRGVC